MLCLYNTSWLLTWVGKACPAAWSFQGAGSPPLARASACAWLLCGLPGVPKFFLTSAGLCLGTFLYESARKQDFLLGRVRMMLLIVCLELCTMQGLAIKWGGFKGAQEAGVGISSKDPPDRNAPRMGTADPH